MPKNPTSGSLLNLSVEEENLAAIPFAVLERRVGKKIGKIEIKGTKVLPDGSEVRVVWQVQGNNDLGLPTEQDLDIFVALGVLTFRNNFSKTVSFSGREIARILNIASVHGKFYTRLKMAMDRFIPLRFRALTSTDRQEEVKWLNVFQEASFSLDRGTGRCTGSVTWTDKLIQSMDSGFFRLLDAGRYMELDGITAKHLYRFLAVAFEKKSLVVIDARRLATEHLGILNVPKYFSRLMQTLEPAFEQLMRIQVLGSYHIVSNDDWRLALHRHPSYVSGRKSLLLQATAASAEMGRSHCQHQLETAGFTSKQAQVFCDESSNLLDLYTIDRACRLLNGLRAEGVLPHVAMSFIRRALEAGASSPEGTELLDWCEISLEVCHQKKRAGQNLKNAAGLLIKIIKDTESRERLVGEDVSRIAKERFRQREAQFLRREEEAEEQKLLFEYEQFRQRHALELFQELAEANRQTLRRDKAEMLRKQERLDKILPDMREQEIDELILQDLAKEAAPFERWRVRKRAEQALLPFGPPDSAPEDSLAN